MRCVPGRRDRLLAVRLEAVRWARLASYQSGLGDAQYHGAFVRDPDGNKIEVVTYAAE